MNKVKSNEILSILEELIVDPKCELDYKDNFTLCCAVLLSSQTTDKRVNTITPILFEKYPTIESLMNARVDDVINIIKPLGLAVNKAKNLIALAKIVHEKYNDILPNTFEELTSLPGVGRKTANVILAVGFNIPAFPVDTHLHRMAERLKYAKKGSDVDTCEEAYKKYIPKDKWIKAHHLFLLYARYTCKSKNPLCEGCRLKKYCVND